MLQEVVRLEATPKQGLKPDERPSRPILAAGCCIDFHPVRPFPLRLCWEKMSV